MNEQIEPEVINFLLKHKDIYEQLKLSTYLELYPSVDHIMANVGDDLVNMIYIHLNNIFTCITENFYIENSVVDSRNENSYDGPLSSLIIKICTRNSIKFKECANIALINSLSQYFNFMVVELSKRHDGELKINFIDIGKNYQYIHILYKWKN